MAMITRIFRVLSGFLLACLAAGLTKLLFAYTPAELSNLPPEVASDYLALALPLATHTAIFSAPFALVAIAIGEWRRWRDWAYYALTAMAIALIGYFAQYQSETATQGWSIAANNYALVAFLTTGFVGGLVYWLFSGRLAGHHLLAHGNRPGIGGHGPGHGVQQAADTFKKPGAAATKPAGNGQTSGRRV
jgi:hypothetical protein